MKSLDLPSVRFGLVLAMITLGMGVYLGLNFGKYEDDIKAELKSKAETARYYGGDEARIKKGVGDSWKYLKRSHEHYQGLGAIAVGLMLLAAALPLKPVVRSAISIGVGLGALCYPTFWYIVAWRTADVGKSAAKESLALFAQFGAGIYTVSFLCMFAAVICYAIWKDNQPAFLEKFMD